MSKDLSFDACNRSLSKTADLFFYKRNLSVSVILLTFCCVGFFSAVFFTACRYYYNNDNQLTKYGACDYFISKNNTLHFISSGSYRYSTRFKIKAYDGNKLTLETFSGNGTLVLSKVVPSGVNAPQREDVPDEKYYSIDGKRLPSAPSHGVYINNKKKYIK